MDTQHIVEAFRQLPTDDRVRLIEKLWDEVAQELEQQPLSEAQQRRLDERIREHEAHPGDVEAWETPGAPQPLRELRGAFEIEEEEDALLRPRTVVDARYEVAQHVGADQTVHLEHEVDRDREHDEEGQGIDQVGVGEARQETPWLEIHDHLPSGPAPKEQCEHHRAAERQVRPEAEPPEPRAQPAVADEHHVAADQERDEDRVDETLDRR